MEALSPELGPSAYSPQPPGFAAADVGGTNLRGAFLYVGGSILHSTLLSLCRQARVVLKRLESNCILERL